MHDRSALQKYVMAITHLSTQLTIRFKFNFNLISSKYNGEKNMQNILSSIMYKHLNYLVF